MANWWVSISLNWESVGVLRFKSSTEEMHCTIINQMNPLARMICFLVSKKPIFLLGSPSFGTYGLSSRSSTVLDAESGSVECNSCNASSTLSLLLFLVHRTQGLFPAVGYLPSSSILSLPNLQVVSSGLIALLHLILLPRYELLIVDIWAPGCELAFHLDDWVLSRNKSLSLSWRLQELCGPPQ